ncbi:MAG: transketolase C-terminal domain-containing protein [Phycisphaerae bacterium]
MATQVPIPLQNLKPLTLSPKKPRLAPEQKETLKANIQLCRDAIIFFTAVADAKGLGGHTGGPYDTVPEVLILRALAAGSDQILPIYFDEAGHRVATQYLLAALDGDIPFEKLLHYREYNSGLPGHPERDLLPGIKFSSGRLGHMWPFVNGVAMANPGKACIVLGSDGSQMEGNDAEAARLAVAKNLNVKVLIDDNDVTISGHPSDYLPRYSTAQSLQGHGLPVEVGDGEDLDSLYTRIVAAINTTGPVALINKRKMAPGVPGLEGSAHGHDVIKVSLAIPYLEAKGYNDAVAFLKNTKPDKHTYAYQGSSGSAKNRDLFGKIVNEILDAIPEEKRIASVRVFDCDLEGSCGLNHIHKAHPEVFVEAGIMERGNYSAAAGFGFEKGKQGIFATFSAFLEMVISEITMARLNKSNVLAHFSHAGCDDMADNTCHFGINNFFAANGLPGGLPGQEHDNTRLFFPADQYQFAACLKKIFHEEGLRFIFSTRSAVPDILGDDGQPFYKHKPFAPGKDDVIRPTNGGGYIVSFGETLYRALDAVINLNKDGGIGAKPVGLICKASLNAIDESMMKTLVNAPFVLVAESFNVNTGLGIRFGTELLKRGFKGKYNHIGTYKDGSGGLWQQMGFQGLDPAGIAASAKKLA